MPLAARLGVAIGVETHDAFAASSTVAELLALLSADGVPADQVGAVWDSHHPHRMGETPAEVYANLGRRILLAQVKDARRTAGGEWRLVLLGAGEVPVAEMLGLLACRRLPGTGSRWNGRSAGTPGSRRPRSRSPSTWTC